MCCCGKPVVNGELGYKWQPSDAPSVRTINPPEINPDIETLLYDEPGRCGGIDSHCHHYRVTKWSSRYYLRVRHGGGDDAVPLRLYGNGLKDALAAMDSNTRYWLLNEIYHVHHDAEQRGRDLAGADWRKAAAEKRIKTRKLPSRGSVKVWIEPAIALERGNTNGIHRLCDSCALCAERGDQNEEIMKDSPEEIQRIIRERVAAYKPAIWSWPHDTFMNEPWGYAIHQASVGAWNDEGRETECVQFLLDWATTENIEIAVKNYESKGYTS